MSLFSRLFGKVPSPASAPAPAAASPRPAAADRALAAAADEQALSAALQSRDLQALARLVVAGASTKIRQAAAEAIEDPEVLRQLIREVRGGKDKNVYKILASKRDAQLAQSRKAEQLQAGISAAAADLERHSQRGYDHLYSLRLDQFARRWNEVAAQADPELRGKVQQWLDRCREINAEHLRQIAAEAAREQSLAEAAAEARRLSEEQAQAAAAAAIEQARLAEEQKRAQDEKQQAEQQAVRELGELIRKARAALGDGSTSRAAGLRRTLEDKLAGAPPLPPGLASQLQQLDKQLHELKDWKTFSVAPKRAELIEAMEMLIGAPYEPPALAEKIKNLREEWRTLGKGAGGPADAMLEADWQRFQDAAQKAYQPCAEYFAAQALIREENLRRREAVLARLTEFQAATQWEQPDWRAVIDILRASKQQWRSHSPVDRQAGKPQDKAFTAVLASLQGRLDAEYARNLQQKQALVERARQLSAGEDSRKAADAVKELQKAWQAVGPVPREADQRLWSEFRQHCDAVFQKRQQESAAFAAGLESNKAQAIALCEQVEKLAELEGAELLAGAATLADLKKSFDALGEFPRADARDLRSRLERALERCKKAVARQQAREAERGWDELFEAANRVRAYRLAVARGQDGVQLDSLKAAAEARMVPDRPWPKGGLEALRQSLAAAGAADLAANETVRRMLCIRAEVQADMPTPPEDQALRKDYLLQRLARKMGQGMKAEELTLDSLAIEWLKAGAVEDAVYESLLERFRRCRARSGAVA